MFRQDGDRDKLVPGLVTPLPLGDAAARACPGSRSGRGGPGISDRVISWSCLSERRDEMGKVTRKRYGAEFKAKVALDAIRGEQTLAELSAKHGIHQAMIAAWKRQAIEGLASTFSGKAEAVQATEVAERDLARASVR